MCAYMPQTTLLMSSSSLMPSCELWSLLYYFGLFSLILRDGLHWSVNSKYVFLLPSSIRILLIKTVFSFSFHSNTSISNSASDWFLSFLVSWGAPNPPLFFIRFFSKVDTHEVFLLDVVDEGFNGVLIFIGIRWVPFSEYSVFYLGDVSIEDWFLHGFGIPILVYG